MNEQDLIQRLERIEAALNTIITQRRIKDYYSTTEVATALDKAEFTVREWCRLGRVVATKRQCGRGQLQRMDDLARGTAANPERRSSATSRSGFWTSATSIVKQVHPKTSDMASRWASGKRCV